MNRTISLVAFNDVADVEWKFGNKFSIDYSVEAIENVREEIIKENSSFILFWDLKNTLPNIDALEEIIESKGNLWHVGSKVGLKNKPKLLEAIQPTNMLHMEINNSIDHSSWKHTFKGSLMKYNVFEEIELSNYSNSLDIIGLDFGYKAMKSGVLTRYSHLFLQEKMVSTNLNLTKKEELLFIRNNFDTKAFVWCYLLCFLKISPYLLLKAYKKKEKRTHNIYEQNTSQRNLLKGKDLSVSIVIATLERYPYLEKELEELRLLEIPVQEIIIVDQTPKENRDKEFLKSFDDLPIIYIETDKIGQCSARNKGIEIATSKFIWFLDDDMEEIPANYLEKHLETIYALKADVSCGVPDEIGTDFIDRSIPKIELSDGFPTNDVLVKRSLLLIVDGFDVKMDQKQSEDHEIGIRCLKEGALSVKNNQLRIVHLRASRGGLRNHNVRKVTFASSRKNLFQRRFLHSSEIYLNLKHFSKEQVKNLILLNIRGTFIVRGGMVKKIIKILLGFLLLPNTIYKINKKYNLAKKELNEK